MVLLEYSDAESSSRIFIRNVFDTNLLRSFISNVTTVFQTGCKCIKVVEVVSPQYAIAMLAGQTSSFVSDLWDNVRLVSTSRLLQFLRSRLLFQ